MLVLKTIVYMLIKNNGYVSWHFTVGDNEIYQELPITVSGWHSGDGTNGTGNRKSIGIEIAEVDGAEEMAIKFVAELLVALNMTIDKVVPHKHWSGKNCPRLILPHWDVFIDNIKKEFKELNNEQILQQAKTIIQSKSKIDNNSVQYLSDYIYGNELLIKLANGMGGSLELIKEEIPKEDKIIRYKKYSDNIHEMRSDVANLGMRVVDKKIWDITEYTNIVNGTFFLDGKWKNIFYKYLISRWYNLSKCS